nr:MAG: ORF1 [Torque teno midi virus]
MAYFWWRKYRRPARRRWRRWRWPRRRRRKRTYRRRTAKRTAPRRKRTRRRRVRKKKKTTTIKQWAPESIRNCKIIGLTPLILGCTGRQMNNYIYWQDYWTHTKCPAGGGFSVMKFSLAYLYEDYKRLKNIWTHSNCDYDLCKYVKTVLYLYPHPEVDFIVVYTRNYPMVVDEHTYMSTHPFYLLLRKHKKIIPSRRTNPRGKQYYKLTIKPPRQSINKWFFQKHFNDTGIFMLQASACDLTYSYLGSNSRNRLLTFSELNLDVYGQPNWAVATLTTYNFKIDVKGTAKTMINNKLIDYTVTEKLYTTDRLKWESGMFNAKFLNIQYYSPNNKKPPVRTVQYNPVVDNGKGNTVYFISVLQTSWAPPTTDRLLIWKDRPLWLLFYGLEDYILKAKNSSGALRDYICVIQSNAIFPQHDKHVLIGNNFLNGLTECGTTPTAGQLDKWFLTLEDQNQCLNEIVKSGPYIQDMDGFRGSWELKMKYKSYWKWGGAQPPLKAACDPYQQEIFPVPDSVKQSLQIIDPAKQIPECLFHSWDYRRGLLTKSALKRMQSYLSDAELSSTDTEETPKKRRKIGDPPCPEEKANSLIQNLQSFCQKTQETPGNEQLQQLEQQQHQRNLQLLKIISELKRRQLNLQLVTGLME